MADRVILSLKEQRVPRHPFETLAQAGRATGDGIQAHTDRHPQETRVMRPPNEAFKPAPKPEPKPLRRDVPGERVPMAERTGNASPRHRVGQDGKTGLTVQTPGRVDR